MLTNKLSAGATGREGLGGNGVFISSIGWEMVGKRSDPSKDSHYKVRT